MIKIAVDGMGGDHAPAEIVKGALQAVDEFDVEIILVGKKEEIKKELSKTSRRNRIAILETPDVILMEDSPTSVLRRPHASVNVAVNLLKNKQADAVISAGNTGAFMTSALFNLKRIEGIDRPAIATIFPTTKGKAVILDMGANVDCKPQNLLQFAYMGSFLAQNVLHIRRPRVGLLNIGEENEKGNQLTQETFPLLEESSLNFIGNVESKSILDGTCDVIVCDGFVGNVILKFAEGVGSVIFSLFKEELKKDFLSKIGLLFFLPALSRLRRKIDYDEYGGALLLGVNGVCVKAHGRAKAKAIKNAIGEAFDAVKEDIVGHISKMKIG